MRPVGTGEPAHHIDRGVNRMSAHPGEFIEGTHSIPQDWASLARYLARRSTALGPGRPRQFAGGYGNLNYLIEINGEPADCAGPRPGRCRTAATIWRANTAFSRHC